MSSRNRLRGSGSGVTYIEELPPLSELEHQAVASAAGRPALIEHYSPRGTGAVRVMGSTSPYASSATMYGGDPNRKPNPIQLFPPRINMQEEMDEKDKLLDKATQKIPSRIDGAVMAMPARLGPNSNEREYIHTASAPATATATSSGSASREGRDSGRTYIHPEDHSQPQSQTSRDKSKYSIPDDSFVVYQELNKNTVGIMPSTYPRPIHPSSWYYNQLPSYTPSSFDEAPPSPPQQHHHHQMSPQRPQYQHDSISMCDMVSRHIMECEICSSRLANLFQSQPQSQPYRRYIVAQPPMQPPQQQSASTAIYVIIILLLVMTSIYMFRRRTVYP